LVLAPIALLLFNTIEDLLNYFKNKPPSVLEVLEKLGIIVCGV
jgi:hypothetical protein